MKVKVIIIGMVLILAFSLLQTVTSFTKAEINSDASIKITNQENALISVIPEVRIVKLTPEEGSEVTIKVSNRVNHRIGLKGNTGTIDGITYSYGSASLKKGEKKSIQLKLESDKQIVDQNETEIFQIPFKFDWETGEAIIPAEIDIELVKEDAEEEAANDKVTKDEEASQDNNDTQEEAQEKEAVQNNETTKEEVTPEEEYIHENEEERK